MLWGWACSEKTARSCKAAGAGARKCSGRDAMSALTERFDSVRVRLEQAVARSGRPLDSVQLIAVSKVHGAGAVAELAAHWFGKGRPVFGESYMQEAREKIPEVAAQLLSSGSKAEACWHFVGHVQSRKAKDIVGCFELVHSVDSLKLACALQKAWQVRVAGAPVALEAPAPSPQAILVQVNVGREPQKSGIAPDDLEELVVAVAAMPELSLQGLMCLPPLAEIGEHSRTYFAMLRELRDRMERACGRSLPHLSMGMSDDFEAAVEEGATLVRIGTDIFGPRASTA